jgi:glycine cleavage system H protein
VVESVKAASDVYAPISGEVIENNQALVDDPSLINQSPEKDGWFFRISIKDSGELAGLMDAAAYEKYVKELA